MSNDSTSKISRTDWARLDAMRDEDIDLSDIPEITAEQMARATLRVGGKPMPTGKVRVSLYLDAEVIAYYKAQANENDYQALINETLKAYIRHEGLEDVLRRVIRDELQNAAHRS